MSSRAQSFLLHQLGDGVFTAVGNSVLEFAMDSGAAKIILSGKRLNAFDFLNNDLLFHRGFRRFAHAPLVKSGA